MYSEEHKKGLKYIKASKRKCKSKYINITYSDKYRNEEIQRDTKVINTTKNSFLGKSNKKETSL